MQNTFSDLSWSSKKDMSFPTFPFVKGALFKFTLVIRPNAFDVYVDDVFRCAFEHRFGKIQKNQSLFFVVPIIENHYGDKEIVEIHKLAWTRTTPPERGAGASGSGASYDEYGYLIKSKSETKKTVTIIKNAVDASGFDDETSCAIAFAGYGFASCVPLKGGKFRVFLSNSDMVKKAVAYLHNAPSKDPNRRLVVAVATDKASNE